MLSLARISLFALLLTSSAIASSHESTRLRQKRGMGHKKNFDVSKRDDTGAQLVDREQHNSTLSKRAFTGRGTFYYTGLGACGQYSQDSDYMVALNSAQYGSGYPGPNCFKYITIQSNGVTISGIEILDECPTCDFGALDLSPGLFNQFHSSNGGTLDLTWWFDGDAPAATSTSTTQEQTSTWTPDPTTTSTWTPPTTTSSTTQWSPAPTSTSTTSTWTPTSTEASTTSSSSSSSSSSSASVTSSIYAMNSTNPFAVVSDNGSSVIASASATASISASSGGSSTGSSSTGQGNLEALNGLVAAYGQLIVVGAGGHSA